MSTEHRTKKKGQASPVMGTRQQAEHQVAGSQEKEVERTECRGRSGGGRWLCGDRH